MALVIAPECCFSTPRIIMQKWRASHTTPTPSANGTMGPAAKAAIAEAEALATVVGVPVHTVDERRSTVTADQAMIQAGMRAPARRKVVDKVAAAVLLQHWLDGRAGRP